MAEPKSSVPFQHGAAGHDGLTSNASGTILTKPCTEAEIAFYESASGDPSHAAFYAHMPTYIGALRPAADQAGLSKLLHSSDGVGAAPPPPNEDREQQQSNKEWKPSGGAKLSTGLAICLENTASGMLKPCVLDVKLGARLWDDAAPLAKRQKLDEVAASSTSGSLGFRVAGMKVWRGDPGAAGEEVEPKDQEQKGHVTVQKETGYTSYDKFYGRQFKDARDVKAAFEAFLPTRRRGSNNKYWNEIGERFVRELESVVYTLENTESRMYSASLLFVYEGDEEALGKALEFERRRRDAEEENEGDDQEVEVEVEGDGVGKDENDEDIEPKVHDLRLIDFAHARWAKGEGPDENALRGVRNCLEVLKEVLSDEA